MNTTVTREDIETVLGFVDNRECLWNYHPSYQPALDAAVASGEVVLFPVLNGDGGPALWGYWRDLDALRRAVSCVIRGMRRDLVDCYGRNHPSWLRHETERRATMLKILRAYRACAKTLAQN